MHLGPVDQISLRLVVGRFSTDYEPNPLRQKHFCMCIILLLMDTLEAELRTAASALADGHLNTSRFFQSMRPQRKPSALRKDYHKLPLTAIRWMLAFYLLVASNRSIGPFADFGAAVSLADSLVQLGLHDPGHTLICETHWCTKNIVTTSQVYDWSAPRRAWPFPAPIERLLLLRLLWAAREADVKTMMPHFMNNKMLV